MRKIVYSTSLPLDGNIDASAGDLSWVFSDKNRPNNVEAEIDTFLYGRRMSVMMVEY